VSKSKVEFVQTADYEAGAKAASHWWSSSASASASASAGGAASSSSSSSWGGWFGGGGAAARPAAASASASEGGGARAPAPRAACDSDADVVVADVAPAAGGAKRGPGSFGPFLHHYKTPFELGRHQQLLAAAWGS
jgi:hypothetical protein